MSDCTHLTSKLVWRSYEHPITGEEIGEWVIEQLWTYDESQPHRFWCTQCGEVFYYSTAARRYFEEGITCNIKGLDQPRNQDENRSTNSESNRSI